MRSKSFRISAGMTTFPSNGSPPLSMVFNMILLGIILTILAIPPVIPQMRMDLGLSETEVGIVSGLPPVLFALAAVVIWRAGTRLERYASVITRRMDLGQAFGGLLLAFAGGIAALATYFLRLPMSRVLRLTR